jgi:hypothetical protein
MYLILFISSNFGLKSILSDMSIATPACFQLPLAWYIVFHSFTVSLYVPLSVSCVSYKQQIVGSYLLI